MKIAKRIENEHDKWTVRRFIRTTFPHLGQTAIHKAIRTGDICLATETGKKKIGITQLLRENDIVLIWDKIAIPQTTPRLSKEHEYAFLKPTLIQQTENLWFFNKPAGLPMQGGTNQKTSLDFLLTGWMNQFDIKPHLVHRLDKFTTGVCAVATNSQAAFEIGKAFYHKRIKKTYLALCENKTGKIFQPNQTGEFTDKIDDKEALTHYTIKAIPDSSLLLVECYPHTGRKHQIRIHTAQNGMPILGDIKYNPETIGQQIHLHAYRIAYQTNEHTPKIPSFDIKAPLPGHLKIFEQYYLEE